jgi:hypothetical protein
MPRRIIRKMLSMTILPNDTKTHRYAQPQKINQIQINTKYIVLYRTAFRFRR